jgi:hypothetical protein
VYSNEDDVRLTIGDNEANLRIPGGEDYRNCDRV